jgi:ferric-dicitrate binding protein FerR (iron transport regulator)
LLFKRLQGSLSPAEQHTLDEWQRNSSFGTDLLNELQTEESMSRQLKSHHPDNWHATNARIKAAVEASSFPALADKPVHRVHLLRTAWFRYAAVVILFLTAGIYLWTAQRKEPPATMQTAHVKFDLPPGTQRATLTLANGQKIAVDSSSDGPLIRENGTAILREDGRIVYNKVLTGNHPIAFNTMSTPKGGQYQITLSDGTRAWLNAESSITFPTSFTGANREVSIHGEVYMEVAKDAAKPFLVNVNSGTQIEVLGTAFNVNAYLNEENISTTVLQGAVNVWPGIKPRKQERPVTLKPGQQVEITLDNGSVKLVNDADLDKTVAWKNGVFNFEDLPLEKAMRQLARWYDIQIFYEQNVRPVQFGGTLKKSLPLSSILHFLEGAGLRYRLEGKNRLVILNN